MSQSTLIAGALVLAYLFYITAKGELPSYLGVFFGTVNTSAATSAAAATAASLGTTGIPLTTGPGDLGLGGATDPTADNPLFLPGTDTPVDTSGSANQDFSGGSDVAGSIAGSDLTGLFGC